MSSSFFSRFTSPSSSTKGTLPAPSVARPSRKVMPAASSIPAPPPSTKATAARNLPVPPQSSSPVKKSTSATATAAPAPAPRKSKPAQPQPQPQPQSQSVVAAPSPSATATTATAPSSRSSSAASRGHGSRFTTKKLLGKGAFADVWLAIDSATQEEVAIKAVHSRRHFKAAQYEYYIASMLDHPNIVKTTNCLTSEDQLLVVQEYAPGGELFDRITKDYGMEEEDIRQIFSNLLDALEYMHAEGVVHRDIKPENVVLGKDMRAMLCDFGMAEFSGQTVAHGPGTLPYMPPETLSSKKTYVVHPSQDMWSLGVVLYILLVGDFPWMKARVSDPEYAVYHTGDRSRGPWAHFTPELRELLSRLMAIDPARRCTPAEAREYLHDPWFVSRPPPKTQAVKKPEAAAALTHTAGSSSSASSTTSFDI